jgi:hypothetical protein
VVYRALHVKHRARLLERSDHAPRQFGIADANEPVSHRSEDRLDDHLAAEGEHSTDRVHRVVRALADDRFGHRQPGLLQQRGRVELVHRPFDGTR